MHGQQVNVQRFYKRADCYLMCSESESFGRVTLEAMLHALPIIGKVGTYTATGEIIRDNIDGFHYKEFEELVAKMEFIMTYKDKGIEMGLSGKKRALEEFSLNNSLEKIERILTKIDAEKQLK